MQFGEAMSGSPNSPDNVPTKLHPRPDIRSFLLTTEIGDCYSGAKDQLTS